MFRRITRRCSSSRGFSPTKNSRHRVNERCAHWDRKTDLWLFGYGSLIWNPGLPTVEAVRSKVHGYHRGLYLWSRVNRGTPEQPGLVLALDRGGSCTGMAFRLAADGAMPHLEVLWRREMAMDSYRVGVAAVRARGRPARRRRWPS